MKYLFGSNLCIAIMNGTARQVTASLDRAIEADGQFYIPSIVVHELWFGVAKSQQVQANTRKLLDFLRVSVKTLDFSSEDARQSGQIRVELARRGRRLDRMTC